MKRGFALLATLLVVTSGAMAMDTGRELYSQETFGQSEFQSPESFTFSRQDTIWWGDDDGTGYAIEGGTWDFEGDGGTGDFQGWTSIDLTQNLDTYFYRVSDADFVDDPVNPMMTGAGDWMLWCGIHEDDAAALDYIAGMGYGDSFCQSAFSPMYAVTDQINCTMTVGFNYFNDTEVDWDYTFLYVVCYDGAMEPIEGGEIEIDRLTGDLGSPDTPLVYAGAAVGGYPSGTAYSQFEIRFVADGAWSDEDGLYDCIYGPFAGDAITVAQSHGDGGGPYLFETDAEGWTFNMCEGVGTFMGLVDEETYTQWLDFVELTCTCTLSGWALEFVDEVGSLYTIPGHFAGQHEQANSGIVAREGYLPPDYNTTIVFWDNYVYLTHPYGCFYRQGYQYYPFTTEANPTPHWSRRRGQNTHYYTGDDPGCGLNGTNLTTLDGQAGNPMPNTWTEMQFTYDVYCSCEAFGIPSTICVEEGNTAGSPVIDNVRVGLTGAPDAPAVANLFAGGWLHDGYGQTSHTYVDPADVGNSNATTDLSSTGDPNDTDNDWHRDSTGVAGPTVNSEEERWLVELCFQVYPGPRQQLIPEYLAWKARLGGDPEADFVCALMDSVETPQGIWRNKFLIYFHEDDPAFDQASGDLSTMNEILPDSIWTPGTGIQYYYKSYWYNGGAPPEDFFIYPFAGGYEFEILPDMRAVETGDSYGQDLYEVVWPCALYVDAFNRGVEYFVFPIMEQNGIEFDKFDYQDASSNWHTPFARSFGGTNFNPGGYGNNGLTAEQLFAYRLIFWNTGTFGAGCGEDKDWPMLDEWLTTTQCGLDDIRRGIIFDGDQIAQIMVQDIPAGRDFLNNRLGVDFIASSYRLYANDNEFCVFLEPDAGAVFEVLDKDLTIYGNGCPQEYNYNVLGIQAGVPGVVGNYWFFETDYAQVVRDHADDGRNFRSVVDGFSINHVTYADAEEDCPADSAHIVEGASTMLDAMLGWMTDPTQPWDPWFYPCVNLGVDEGDETHLSGPANFLFASRPNPFHNSATIRFSLASAGHVDVSVIDVSGRVIRTLVDGTRDAGENTVVWDGLDNGGNRVGGGVYWVAMSAGDYSSGKKMVVIGR